MVKLLPLFLLILLISILKINAQTQLTDFNYRTDDKDSYPSGFVQLGNQILFVATTEAEGRELWFTDGSANNTKLLKDINPGNGNGITTYFRESSVMLNNQLFFIANDGENGTQIWSTEGTEQSTKPITNFRDLNTSKLTLIGDYFFFTVFDLKNNVLQVWRSDGTKQGTTVVKGNIPASSGSTFEGTANNLFFFTFQSFNSEYSKVWRSDGTNIGTFPVTQPIAGNGADLKSSSAPTQYLVFKNELYFVAKSQSIFSEYAAVGIMKTDGTVKNTVPVKAVHDGYTTWINFADAIEVNNKLYFSFFELKNNNLFIWESDGTESGTKKIYDESSTNFFVPSNFSSDDKNLIFTGKSSGDGTSLLKLNLDTYSVQEVKELAGKVQKPGFFIMYDAVIINKISNSNFLLFESFYLNRQGWKSDLSEANTIPVEQLKYALGATVVNENAYFYSNYDKEGYELWKSDLTFTNPHQLSNINKSKYGLDNYESIVLNDKIIFRANNGVSGNELWVYDNSTKEKKLLKDIVPGKKYSMPSDLKVLNNKLYFAAFNGEFAGFDVWQSDGTEEGTSTISKPIDYKQYVNIKHLTKSQGKLFFVATLYIESLKTNREFLCVTDGVKTDALKQMDGSEYGAPYRVVEMVSAGNYVYFNVFGYGVDLWRSDGTVEGTIKIKDLGAIKNLTAVDNKVYFVGSERYDYGYELWQSDGSSTGTTMIKDIGENYDSSPEQLINFNGKLVFSAYTQQSGREYWITDGTSEGTLQIADINPGTNGSAYSGNVSYYTDLYRSSVPADYTIVNDFLYFSANDGTHGTELWKTDGTAAGTVLVRDINQGKVGSFPKHFASNNDKIYFGAYSSASGTEVWTTEGTSSTTKQLLDFNIGAAGSMPSKFIFLNDELFFVAEKNNSGLQLWQYNQDKVTGIHDPSAAETFIIYPNPASEYLYIEKKHQQIRNLKIYNLQGQDFKIHNDASGKIYVGSLLPNIYFLYIETDKKIIVQKFIKR